MFSPGPKETGSDPSANSSRSSSVKNSKNLTPRSVSSIFPSPLQPRIPWRDYTPAFRPGAQCEKPLERSTSLPGIPKGVTISAKRNGRSIFAAPALLGSNRGEVKVPATNVRPTVSDLDDHGIASVGHQQVRAERQVRRRRRVLGVGLENVPTRRQVALEPRPVPARQLGVGQGIILKSGQRYGERTSHQQHLETRLQESPLQIACTTSPRPYYVTTELQVATYRFMRLFVNQLHTRWIHIMWCQRRSLPTCGGFLPCEAWRYCLGLSLFFERAPVALDAGLELGELTIGGALGSAGHLAAGGELCEGLTYPEGFDEVVPALVEGGESLVRVAADELLTDADLVELDGPLGVAVVEGQLGLLVALHRGLEVAKRVFFSPDPRPLFLFEPVERRRLTRGPIPPAKDVPQTSENQALPFRYARLSITKGRVPVDSGLLCCALISARRHRVRRDTVGLRVRPLSQSKGGLGRELVARRPQGHFPDGDHRRAPGVGGGQRSPLLARATHLLRGAHLGRPVLADGAQAPLRHGRRRQRALPALPSGRRPRHRPYRRP